MLPTPVLPSAPAAPTSASTTILFLNCMTPSVIVTASVTVRTTRIIDLGGP
ncbi:hypothetical protein B296_00003447 [Ensete ventricosum]|uniref:Uncharacterized protein n=1 Tax=Ensete ventricosum TaxID=4639 RepID=A0A426ZKX6_ENSVE|nr:hypothetical protein B296_00003447 [Ensete ventricosum]